MKKIYLLLIISFIFEAIFTNYISYNTYLNPLFFIMSLILINDYVNKKEYYKICVISGILYDMIYTNTIFLHGILFLLLGYAIIRIDKYLTKNIISIPLITLITIIIYRVFKYILICIVSIYSFSWINLFKSIITSIVINIIYIYLIYFILQLKVINKK